MLDDSKSEEVVQDSQEIALSDVSLSFGTAKHESHAGS